MNDDQRRQVDTELKACSVHNWKRVKDQNFIELIRERWDQFHRIENHQREMLHEMYLRLNAHERTEP